MWSSKSLQDFDYSSYFSSKRGGQRSNTQPTETFEQETSLESNRQTSGVPMSTLTADITLEEAFL